LIILDLLAHAADFEIVHLGVPMGALDAEGAGERTAAIGLDHRRQAAVEKFILDSGQPWRGDFLDLAMAGTNRVDDNFALRRAIGRGFEFALAEFLDREPAIGEGVNQRIGAEIAFSQEIDVDLGMAFEILALAIGLERNVGSAHDGEDAGIDFFGDAEEFAAQRFVPDVVAQHEDVRRLCLERLEQFFRIHEQPGFDVGTVPIHHGFHVGNTQRHAIVC
jgi:hypothetical protein